MLKYPQAMLSLQKILRAIQKNRSQILIAFLFLLSYLICIFYFRNFISGDLSVWVTKWYSWIKDHGFSGIASVYDNTNINYPSTYPFLLWIVSLFHIGNDILAIKLVSVIFDILSAVVVYLIIKKFRPNSSFLPVLGGGLYLFIPTVLFNSGLWGQCDSIYSFFVLASLLAIYKKKLFAAWILIGFSLSFKLMGLYFIPVLVYHYVKNFNKYSVAEKLSPALTILPLLLMSIPGTLAGLSFFDSVIMKYMERTDLSTGNLVVGNFGSFLQFIPNIGDLKIPAVILTVISVVLVGSLCMFFVKKKHRNEVDLLVIPILLPLLCYFFMPLTHERYDYAIVLISFVIAFVSLKKEYVAVFIALALYDLWIYSYYLRLFTESPYPETDGRIFALVIFAVILYMVSKIVGYIDIKKLKIDSPTL